MQRPPIFNKIEKLKNIYAPNPLGMPNAYSFVNLENDEPLPIGGTIKPYDLFANKKKHKKKNKK